MRKYLLLAALCCPALLFGQTQANFLAITTAYPITDGSGNAIGSGTFCAYGTDANDNAIPFRVAGQNQVVMGPSCATITNGVLATFHLANPAVTAPIGVRYHITVANLKNHQATQYPGVVISVSAGVLTWDWSLWNPAIAIPSIPTSVIAGPQGIPGTPGPDCSVNSLPGTCDLGTANVTAGGVSILQSILGLPSSQVGIFIGGLTSAAPNSVVLDVFPPGFGSFTNGIVFEDYATSGTAITLGQSGSGNTFSQAINFVTGVGQTVATLEGRSTALYAPNDSATVAALECGSQVSGSSCFYDAETRAQFGYLNGYAWIHASTGHFVGFDWNDAFGGTTPKAWFDDGTGSVPTLHVQAVQFISTQLVLTGIANLSPTSNVFSGSISSSSAAAKIADWGTGLGLQTQYACYDAGRGCTGFDGANGNAFLGSVANSKGWELLYQPVSASGIGTVSMLGDALGNVGVGTNINPLLDSFFVTSAGAVTAGAVTAASVASAGAVTGATGSFTGGIVVSSSTDSTTNAAIFVGTGAAGTDFMGFSGTRGMFGYNNANATIQGSTGHGVQFGVNNATFGSGVAGGFDSSGNFYVGTSTTFSSNSFYVNAGSIVNSTIKSTTGTRFVCVDTTGKLVSSASACSGT